MSHASTNSAARNGRAFGPSNAVATLAAVAVIALAALYTLGYTFAVNDDRLGYIHGIYGKSADPAVEARYRAQKEEVPKHLEAIGYDDIAMYRFRFRQTINDNYPLLITLYHHVRTQFFGPAPPDDERFPEFLAHVIFACFLAGMIAATLVVVYVLLVHATPRIAIATALALALMFALKAVPTGGLTQSDALMQGPDWGLPLRSMLMFIKPDPQMDFASYLQKGQLYLLVFAVLALRWSGKLGGSYLCLSLASLFHQAMTWVALGPLLLVDLLLRPKRLFEPWTLVGVGLIAAHAAFDSRRFAVLWQFASPLALLAGGVAAAVLSAAFILWWIKSPRGQRFRERMLARGDIAADVTLLVIVWLAVLGVSYAVTIAIGRVDWLFWGVIAGRTLAVIRNAVFVGLTYLALERFVFGRPFRARAVYTSAALGLMALGALQLHRAPTVTQAIDRGVAQTRAIEARLVSRPAGPYVLQDEATLAYAMIKSVELGRPYVTTHFRYRAGGRAQF